MLPPKVNILICRDAQSVSREAADRFVCASIKAVAEHGAFYVAIPGGSSPKGMFDLLASPDCASLVPWSKTHVFFTDERYVPHNHPDSNYKLANDMLLSKVPIPMDNVHRFRTELPLEEAAKDYERTLRDTIGGDIAFDLEILGIGTDTHTASLFPNSPALDEQTRAAVPNYAADKDSWRLTLTIPALCSAQQVVIIAMGKDKAPALRDAINTDLDIHVHPIQAIRPWSGRLLWLIDAEAASLLS
ncbi:MAG: 6-phosphogluconolactonase [Armatimonadota bacterium]|nr:6-phosphogluconolactonase [bacterium]